jgi:hypothetical protein
MMFSLEPLAGETPYSGLTKGTLKLVGLIGEVINDRLMLMKPCMRLAELSEMVLDAFYSSSS